MKDFVAERAKTTFLKKRVHTIWYCIPMDQIHRAILTAEETFFDECETGNGRLFLNIHSLFYFYCIFGTVPVVVVFTKCDALQVLAVAALTAKDKKLPEQEKLAKVKEVEKSMLRNSTVWERLQKRKNPPKVYAEVKGLYEIGAGEMEVSHVISFGDMHKFNEGCKIVLEKTAAALNDESLQMLFVTTQSANIMLCVKYAVNRYVTLY
ncbi:hypothetical protein JVU11DRAFT_3990 [Chiua virens]|nr:hypothetical protein JVU11DRAFT_3990 [Chiua virens]